MGLRYADSDALLHFQQRRFHRVSDLPQDSSSLHMRGDLQLSVTDRSAICVDSFEVQT